MAGAPIRISSDAAATAIRSLLAQGKVNATICLSEAARLVAGHGGDWRGVMNQVREAVDELQRKVPVALSWKDRFLATRDGPYRIARSE